MLRNIKLSPKHELKLLNTQFREAQRQRATTTTTTKRSINEKHFGCYKYDA